MSSPYALAPDTPGQLQAEANNIALSFEKTGTTTGKITWNIPPGPDGCPSGSTGVYRGVVITVGTAPATTADVPKNEFIYRADPSLDPDLHTGDRINEQLVVAALYDDRETTSIDVTDLQSNTPYYFQAYPVDAQYRYAFQPARSYSQETAAKISPDLPGVQVVGLRKQGASDYGVDGSDGTHLTPGGDYTFEVDVNGVKRTVTINGSNAGTYDDLMSAITLELSKFEDPYRSPIAPNTGTIHVNVGSEIVTQWTGTAEAVMPSVFMDHDPTVLVIGTMWYDPEAGTLKTWNGSAWVATAFSTSAMEPNLPACGKVWFNGVKAYEWSGVAWCELTTFVQVPDPTSINIPTCGTFWFDTARETLFRWNGLLSLWEPAYAIMSDFDPNSPPTNSHWFDETNQSLFTWSGSWVNEPALIISATEPTAASVGDFWYNPETETLKQRAGSGPNPWTNLQVLAWPTDPTDRSSCDLWWNTLTDQMNVWDLVTSSWAVAGSFQQGPVDPLTCPDVPVGSIWYEPTTKVVKVWDGVVWKTLDPMTEVIISTTNPRIPVVGSLWFDGLAWHSWAGAAWVPATVTTSHQDPSTIPTGYFWYDTSTGQLFQRNGILWMPVMFTTAAIGPALGTLWYDTNTNQLKRWDRVRGVDQWVVIGPVAYADLNSDGNMEIRTRDLGCTRRVIITADVGTLWTSLNATVGQWLPGGDGVERPPGYARLGLGTDGTNDERKELMRLIKMSFGWPVVDVELTTEHLNFCIDNALQTLRKRSSIPYKRGFFFLDIKPGQHKYVLTNKCNGYDQIVDIMSVHRLTSAFMSTAHGAGVYSQIILQHLYNFGTFDLLSYDLMGQYVNNLEIMFAARVLFNWSEASRTMTITNRFAFPERVMIDCMVERTEQDLFVDRWTSNWIQKFAVAQAMQILAQIRGKYSTLPGAGGGITLNAGDLNTQATEMIEGLLAQIDDYLVDHPDDVGMGSSIVWG